eukprot:56842-Prymnesium_polylepis.2
MSSSRISARSESQVGIHAVSHCCRSPIWPAELKIDAWPARQFAAASSAIARTCAPTSAACAASMRSQRSAGPWKTVWLSEAKSLESDAGRSRASTTTWRFGLQPEYFFATTAAAQLALRQRYGLRSVTRARLGGLMAILVPGLFM